VTVQRGRRYREAREVLLRTATHCSYCTCEISTELPPTHPQKATADHIIPVAEGGTDDIENLIPACLLCNEKRGTLSVEAFTRLLSHDVEGFADGNW